MIIASRMHVPDSTVAILWDMDGVLLDTLTYDYEVCNGLLQRRFGAEAMVSRETIRRLFPFDLLAFWTGILEETVGPGSGRNLPAIAREIADEHDAMRRTAVFPVNPGVLEVLAAARQQGLKQAVVSNNPTDHIEELLRHAGLLDHFDSIVGNDIESIAKKPAPDPYRLAANRLGVAARNCVVIEDSLLGLTSGRAAGCHTIGVATGACAFDSMLDSGLADQVYESFLVNEISLSPGNVTHKHIHTPNDFVSHMVEHIAWRLGCSIHAVWTHADWRALGQALGQSIDRFPRSRDAAAVLGMIDDGSAEVHLSRATRGEVELRGVGSADIRWFLGLRCEQIATGQPLVELLEGLAEGLRMSMRVTVCTVEDPHHSWEGVFRSIGIALSQMVALPEPQALASTAGTPTKNPPGWFVESRSVQQATVLRRTSESEVRVAVDWSAYAPPECRFDVSRSISVGGLVAMLDGFSQAAQCGLRVEFLATRLSSSHVVMEDTGMVLGRAIREMFEQKMAAEGANGAGSSLGQPSDLDQPIHVGISIEGRKFWKYVPFDETYDEFRKSFLIGYTVGDGLFSEDLDDFIDGLSGGMSCSVVVHIRRRISAGDGWPLIFRALGAALKMALATNANRRGVTPGVKATMA